MAFRQSFSLTKFLFLSDEGPMLETLDYTIRIVGTPTFLYLDLYLYSAYAAHYVSSNNISWVMDELNSIEMMFNRRERNFTKSKYEWQ